MKTHMDWRKIATTIFLLCIALGSIVLVAAQPSARVSPSSQEIAADEQFTIDIVVEPGTSGISSGELRFAFDPSVLQVDNVVFGDLMANPSELVKTIDNTAGTVLYAVINRGAPAVPTVPGTFATITLTVAETASSGTYDLDITSLALTDETPQSLSGITITDGTVIIKARTPPAYSNSTVSPDSPTTYAPGQTYAFNITVQDDEAVDTVLFEFDGDNKTCYANANAVYSYELTDLPAGTSRYKWYMGDTSDSRNSTPSQSYVVLAKWDINGDSVINYLDAAFIGIHYGETTSEPYPAWDINEDGKVDYLDAAFIGIHYGDDFR
jgi:hypothetical protein